jgi:hypothetical protein
MVRIVSTTIGVVLALAFLGFMAGAAGSVPLWIITLGGLSLMAYGMIKDLREGLNRPNDSNGQ